MIIMNTEEKYWDAERFESLFEGEDTKLTVCHIRQSEFDHGRTRHEGILKSDADVCICMTHDCVPYDRNLVKELLEALDASERVAAAYARQLPAADCGVIERYTRDFNYPAVSRLKGKEDEDELGIKTYFCSNVCAAYRRDIYLKLGGFTKKTIFNEDMILPDTRWKPGIRLPTRRTRRSSIPTIIRRCSSCTGISTSAYRRRITPRCLGAFIRRARESVW